MRSVMRVMGEVLYREDKDSGSVYYVEIGAISVTILANGKSTILAKPGPCA